MRWICNWHKLNVRIAPRPPPDSPCDIDLLVDTGPVNPPSLTIGSRSRKVVKSYQDENDTFPLSPFFFREHWDVSDEDYALLLQSMQLASNLLSVGIPFLAHLVPSNSIHADLEDQRLESKSVYQIPRKPRDKKQELEAKAELHEIAKVVKWQLNDTIATGKKWLGITRLVTEDRWGPRPWTDLIEEDVENSDRDLIDRGFQRRPLLIGIMKEYVDALKHYRNSNDEYLRATFLAGVTMTHEVAHAVWHVSIVFLLDLPGSAKYLTARFPIIEIRLWWR